MIRCPAELMLVSSELWLMLCGESCCSRFTGNVASWLNFKSLLTWNEWTVILTRARRRHTECAELVDGFDDAFALFCACAAAPFPVQWDVQQLLMFLFCQRDTHAQLLRKCGCTGRRQYKEQKDPSEFETVIKLRFEYKEWTFKYVPCSVVVLEWPTIIRNGLHIPRTHLLRVSIIPTGWETVLIWITDIITSLSLEWMSFSNKVSQIIYDHECWQEEVNQTDNMLINVSN